MFRCEVFIFKMGHIKKEHVFKSFFSPNYNQCSVRNDRTNKTIDLKHQPELGACPCMRVGGFKRNPIGFSSGEMEHSRRQRFIQKKERDAGVVQQCSLCLSEPF